MTSLQVGALEALEIVLALVGGSSRTHGGCLAPDVRTWLASPEQGLSATIKSVSGPEASADALAALAPSSLRVIATVGSDRACWAEIARGGEAGPETCIAGVTREPGGSVKRVVWLGAPLVPPGTLGVADGTPDARPILESYFAALMNSRFRAAAAQFTPDTLYSHPPYSGGRARVLFRGQDALLQGLTTERGPTPARQIITDLWQLDSRVFVEGVIEGIPDGGTFFSTAEISSAGKIARYVAFYCATRIPRPDG